jgi:hypothetical protein
VRREVSAAEELSDKDFITHYVSKVSIRGDRIEVGCERAPDEEEFDSRSKLTIAFTPTMTLQKGITREPAENGQIDAVAREKLLNAIRRASKWVEAVRSGEAESFADIAAQEGLGERHVRWLSPLAFLSPRALNAILAGSAPAGLTVAKLLNALPHSWGAPVS